LKVVSFDLDGTIFKKGLDDIFWNRLIPELVAREKGISMDEAVRYVINEYDSIGPNDIRWYIPEYWFCRFGLTYTMLDHLLNIMEEQYYANGMYDDVPLLAEIGKRYRLIISTCNPPAMAKKKLSIIKRSNVSVDALFSSISYNMVKSKEFYSIICKEMNVSAESILHVGDDVVQDLKVPRSIGMQAILMDRRCEGNYYNDKGLVNKRAIRMHDVECVVCSIKELIDMIIQ
jgi:putative hydrolase of the HAD superfamily